METAGQTFVGSRLVDGYLLVAIDENPVIESFSKLRDILSKRCGPGVAALFAEPRISRGNGAAPTKIDWYARYEGVVRPLNQLDASSAAAVRRTLERRLAALRPLAFDPECGPLVSAALNVAAPESIISVGGDPVLTDWGMLPLSVARDERARARHFSATLAPVIGEFPLPPLTRSEWAARFTGSSAARAGAEAADAGADAVAMEAGRPPRPASVTPARPHSRSLLTPLVATGVAAAVLGFLMIPGVLLFPADALRSAELGRSLEIARAVAGQLELRRRQLEAALAMDCPTLLQRSGTLLAPPLSEVRVVAAPGAQPSEFLARVDAGTVLVIAPGGTATGFFVTNDTIITDRRIVAGEASVRVAGRAVGLIEAQVIAGGERTLDAGPDQGDFAALRVAAQPNAKPFALTSAVQGLQHVVAVGYPGAEPALERLRHGEASASSSLTATTTEGLIDHLQPPGENGVTLVTHGAEITYGNSGGPLVDLCGRVVGMSTFGPEDEALAWHYALGNDGLSRFLQRAGVTARLDNTPCNPHTVTRAQPALEQAKGPPPPAARRN